MYLIYPWFLAGLFALVIPIAIHLLQLRRPQRLVFSNNSFINEIELTNVRQRKVQYLLILLARVLGIAALVILFCQPFLGNDNTTRVQKQVNDVVLIDNSFSMQRRGVTENSLLEQARLETKGLTHRYDSGKGLTLLNNSGISLTKAGFDQEVNELQFSSKQPISYVKRWQARPNINGVVLSIYSDFQKSGFGVGELNVLGDKKEVMLLPLAGAEVGNLYVDSTWSEDAFVRAKTNYPLHISIKNGGNRLVKNSLVKVYLDSRQVGAYQVTVAPGAVVTSVMQVQIEDSELARGKIVIEDEPINFDNTSYFTLQPVKSIHVLEIGNVPLTQQLYGNEPLFEYAFAKPQDVDFVKLQQANVVVVQEVQMIDSGLRDGLKNVVQNGGSIVIVPSAVPASRSSYQEAFKVLGLGSVQWEATGTPPELRQVAMPNTRTAFFKDVFGAQHKAVTMPKVAPVLRWSRTGTDILRLQDGESYLAEFEQGAGRVYVFSAPFSSGYSDFVAHSLFVPVMYRMAMLSYHNEQLPAYRLTQASVNLDLPVAAKNAGLGASDAQEASFKLVKDSLVFIPGQRVVGQQVRLDVPAGMEEPGFYQVQRKGRVVTTLAFNQDKRESEMASYSADELRTLVGPNRPNVRVVEGGEKGVTLAALRAEQDRIPLWRYFLGLALVCLLAEALLVRFGLNRGKPTTAAVV